MANETELQVQEAEKREVEASGAERTREQKAFVPYADIYETGDEIVVVADMPGVSEETVEITLEQDVLTINGYVKTAPPEGYSLAYAEYDVGDFVRSFRVSNEIDRDGIQATLKDGVLRLHLPKAGPAKTKKIAVKTS
jgi:HSP20 family molecular chaperone IbpA